MKKNSEQYSNKLNQTKHGIQMLTILQRKCCLLFYLSPLPFAFTFDVVSIHPSIHPSKSIWSITSHPSSIHPFIPSSQLDANPSNHPSKFIWSITPHPSSIHPFIPSPQLHANPSIHPTIINPIDSYKSSNHPSIPSSIRTPSNHPSKLCTSQSIHPSIHPFSPPINSYNPSMSSIQITYIPSIHPFSPPIHTIHPMAKKGGGGIGRGVWACPKSGVLAQPLNVSKRAKISTKIGCHQKWPPQ
jgi:hypothetical protein